MTEQLRVLVISHGHPALALGGAEIASHGLHQGLNSLPMWNRSIWPASANPFRGMVLRHS